MKKNIYADLHNHTTFSDGDLSPENLIQKMKSLGVSAVGVTDHDTDQGLERAIAEGKRSGVKVVPGVEISVRFKEDFFTGTLHLLCYFSDDLLTDSGFRQALKDTLEKGRGDDLVRARVAEINRFFAPEARSALEEQRGLAERRGSNIVTREKKEITPAEPAVRTPILTRELTFEEVASYSPTVTRRHFALALAEKHHISNLDIVNQIVGNESPAYLPSGVDLESLHPFTEQFPLLTVLAHPAAGSFPGAGHYKEVFPPLEVVERLLPRFLLAGIRGVEINYPGHIEKHREVLRGWAAKYNLIATGGSDCHDTILRPPGVEGITEREFQKFSTIFNHKDS